jgi:hypothetical protein
MVDLAAPGVVRRSGQLPSLRVAGAIVGVGDEHLAAVQA